MELYKGYLRTNGKVPIDKFCDMKTFDEVKDLPSYAGVLTDGVILIDVDDAEQAEILARIIEDKQIDCIVRQTTRGKHFLFGSSDVNRCGTHKKLAIGIDADIKTGKNTMQVIKIDGAERFIEWDSEGRDLSPLPKWLYPINGHADLFHLGEGQGRNSALYAYILCLTAAGFSKAESREVGDIINKYIFKESLSDSEMETIFRDEAFPKDVFYDGKSFLHNDFAAYLKNEHHIMRINGQLHIYNDGEYVNGARMIESSMIQHLPMLKAQQRTEVLKYLDIICPENTLPADANYIAFKNCIYDISTGGTMGFSPDIVITNRIPWDYAPDAYSELADRTLNKLSCDDTAIRALLEECIGYCFYRRNELSKAFILTGDKSNGKSTFLNMVKSLLGNDNISMLDLSEMEERFSVATMAGKLANIGDDISDEFLQGRAISNFKKIVSGNEVKAEMKNDPNIFFMKPIVKLLFSANDIPRMKDKTGAVLRRLVIIPFKAKFARSDPDYDPYITWKLKDEAVMEYLICVGLEGLKRVLQNNGFTEPAKVKQELEEYELQNNPILSFIRENPVEEIKNKTTQEIHRRYKVFCIENGYTELTLSNFSKELNRRCGLIVKRVRIDGKLTGIYTNGV